MVDDIRRAEFRKWFNRKWSEWDAQQAKRSTQQELADWLSIPRSSVAQYASGRKVAEGVNLWRIADKFGDDIYSILGLDRPVDQSYSSLPGDFGLRLEAARVESERLLRERGLVGGMPEAERVVIETFAKFGFIYTNTEVVPDESVLDDSES